MADFITAKVKLATGGIALEYEGNESFLRADLPKFIEAVTALRNPDLAGSASPLRGTVRDFYVTMEAMSDALTALRIELDFPSVRSARWNPCACKWPWIACRS